MLALKRFLAIRSGFILQLIAYSVIANGFLIIATTLAVEVGLRSGNHVNNYVVGAPITSGLTLLYLGSLLGRRKRTAWFLVLPVYCFILTSNLVELLFFRHIDYGFTATIRTFVLPACIVAGLLYYYKEFNVKSDIRNLTVALRFSVLALLVTLLYGVVGFQLLDTHDFRQEINFPEAIHRTIDQFDFTTNSSLTAYTRRAHLFQDSLTIISIGTVFYVFVSFFQPLRLRLSDQTHNRQKAMELLQDYPASSEDFFKLWPKDKTYFFNNKQTAGVAYHVQRGVALCVGDLFGNKSSFAALLKSFNELCRLNDWQPAFIHVEPKYMDTYRAQHFALQKIGEEAVINLEKFLNSTQNTKYFRHIQNKFTKQGFNCEVFQPPHSVALMKRLKKVSDEWLKLPGRTERGFMMGYLDEPYLQTCTVIVLRDSAGTIQAFLNQIPSYDRHEANYDLLRHTHEAPGNSTDFLLMNFTQYLAESNFKRLNLGLCPLAGLEDEDGDHNVIDNVLQFVYSNGDRLYSFSGLHRFKTKYEPVWSGRYIAYKGGIRGFSKTVYALGRAMRR